MELKVINEDNFEVSVYDWVDQHSGIVCGNIKRYPNVDDESDLRFWMFYPSDNIIRLNCRNLLELYEKIAELNKDY